MPCPGRRPSRTDSYLVTRQRARTHRWRLCWSGVLRDSGDLGPLLPGDTRPARSQYTPICSCRSQYTSARHARRRLRRRGATASHSGQSSDASSSSGDSNWPSSLPIPDIEVWMSVPSVWSSSPNAAGSAVDSAWTRSRASSNTSRESRSAREHGVRPRHRRPRRRGSRRASTSAITASVAADDVVEERRPSSSFSASMLDRIEVRLQVLVQPLDVVDPVRRWRRTRRSRTPSRHGVRVRSAVRPSIGSRSTHPSRASPSGTSTDCELRFRITHPLVGRRSPPPQPTGVGPAPAGSPAGAPARRSPAASRGSADLARARAPPSPARG